MSKCQVCRTRLPRNSRKHRKTCSTRCRMALMRQERARVGHYILVPPKSQSKAHDLIFTPKSLAKELIDRFPLKGKVLEPCRGRGAFFQQLPPHCQSYWCEISEGKDFFDFHDRVDWIIANPPWSKLMQFLRHSVELADNIVFLATINHFMTKARLKLVTHSGFGFKEIYGVAMPRKHWPASGFQLAGIYLQRDWKGPTYFAGEFGS
jgi:hypothetical protein